MMDGRTYFGCSGCHLALLLPEEGKSLETVRVKGRVRVGAVGYRYNVEASVDPGVKRWCKRCSVVLRNFGTCTAAGSGVTMRLL